MRKFRFMCDEWNDDQAFYVVAEDILIACNKFTEFAKEYNWTVSNVKVDILGTALDVDKKNICDWIMRMDVDDFYCLTCALSDNFEFTGLPLFYSCEVCGNEHEDSCEGDCSLCEKFFKEHYK